MQNVNNFEEINESNKRPLSFITQATNQRSRFDDADYQVAVYNEPELSYDQMFPQNELGFHDTRETATMMSTPENNDINPQIRPPAPFYKRARYPKWLKNDRYTRSYYDYPKRHKSFQTRAVYNKLHFVKNKNGKKTRVIL